MIKDSSTALIIIIILVTLFMFFLSEAFGAVPPTNPIYITSICAILYYGEYDCNEKWAIYIYEERDVYVIIILLHQNNQDDSLLTINYL